MTRAAFLLLALTTAWPGYAQDQYDFLLKGGHVIDAKNGINAVRDVAIKDGRIAAVAATIPATQSIKTVDASGLFVTPGLVDIHVHVYPGEKKGTYAGGDWSVMPDGFTLRSCVTTVADAGTSGWRTFDDFKNRVIDVSKTRVTAFLNIVGAGMGTGPIEQNTADMEVKPTLDMALKHKGVVVGIKSAHYNAQDWIPYERAGEIGRIAKIPVMVDFGSARERTIAELFTKYFKPGDIYTHAYSGGGRGEILDGKVNPAIFAAQKKGIFFDIGHGGSSFAFRTAAQAFKEGFYPDSISTDLHHNSMNAAMKDQLNVMSKFLALGMPLDDVVRRSTWNPAKQIQLEQLGHLSVGAPADVAVLRVEKGRFGFADPRGGRMDGSQKLTCELTLRDGKVVYDLNAMTRDRWDTLSPDSRGGDPRWDGFSRPQRPPRRPSSQRR